MMPRVLLIAVLCTCAAPSNAALERLFTNAAERAKLDAASQTHSSATVTNDTSPVAAEQLSVTGSLWRAHGPRTVWVNGAAIASPALQISPDGSVLIRVPHGPPLRIKPGQVLDTATGRVVEHYQLPVNPTTPHPRAVRGEPVKP